MINCPICGELLKYYNTIILDKNNKIIGCSKCLTLRTVENYIEELNIWFE